jgi:hypothetical protein
MSRCLILVHARRTSLLPSDFTQERAYIAAAVWQASTAVTILVVCSIAKVLLVLFSAIGKTMTRLPVNLRFLLHYFVD